MNVIVLTQNFKLDFMQYVLNLIDKKDELLVLSTNYLFEHERLKFSDCCDETEFHTFADFLTDSEMSEIDKVAYTENPATLQEYIVNIKTIKNRFVLKKLRTLYDKNIKGILLSYDNDLGLVDKIWENAGFTKIKKGSFYYDILTLSLKQKLVSNFPTLAKVYKKIKGKSADSKSCIENEFHVYDENGYKYILVGKLNRIDYRLDAKFESNYEEYNKYVNNQFYTFDKAQYLVAWHEFPKCKVPDEPCYDVRYVQDGYLPSNYSDYTYFFKPKNVKYYVWDSLGGKLFKNQGLPFSMLPFRKKIYLPIPNYPKRVKKILVATSASGDWTAQKNRSDDDLLVKVFIEVAKERPDIKIVYRCHPNWIGSDMLGVNSINRIHELFEREKLPNITLSSNIPNTGRTTHTFSRSSLEEDLKDCDIVFGEHSLSMIDAGLKKILFCPVNVTKRRSFAQSLIDLGFASCTTTDDVLLLIDSVSTDAFISRYNSAVHDYNAMTDKE